MWHLSIKRHQAMKALALCNTSYESEIETPSNHNLEHILCSNPLFLQLQYLSFLYAEGGDIALCSYSPEPDFLMRLKTLGINREYAFLSDKKLSSHHLDLWGATPSIALWAHEKNIPLSMPSWDIIKKVNSKLFSFSSAPKLHHAMTLSKAEDAERWAKSFEGLKVFKTAFGLSGRGHRIIDSHIDDKTRAFLQKQWNKRLAIIAEPWVDRMKDFSTQWIISEKGEITYLGATVCVSDSRGTYQKSIILPSHDIGEEHAFFLAEHKNVALPILQKMAHEGFFGAVGIDAMIYRSINGPMLHPIVEINARKTMGWVALTVQKRHFAGRMLQLSLTSDPSVISMLPRFVITSSGEKIMFTKSLCLHAE